MAGWRVVDLLGFQGHLSVRRGSLMVGEQRLPLDEIATVLVGPECSFNTGLAHHAAAFDVAVIFCAWNGEPIGSFLPWSENTRVGARHRAQAALSEPRRKNAWMRVVRAKVLGQAETLEIYGILRTSSTLRSLAARVRSGDPENIEAQAARIYWAALHAGQRFIRLPGASDLMNSAYNYGYTILRGRVLTAIVASGLCPTLGIFHRGRSNAFALADDLIEPFRPVIDRAVVGLDLSGCELSAEAKRQLVQTVRPSVEDSPGPTLGATIDGFASTFALYVEGKSKTLTVPVV